MNAMRCAAMHADNISVQLQRFLNVPVKESDMKVYLG